MLNIVQELTEMSTSNTAELALRKAGLKGIVQAANFQILPIAVAIVAQDVRTTGNGIDAYNDAMADADLETQHMQALREMGFDSDALTDEEKIVKYTDDKGQVHERIMSPIEQERFRIAKRGRGIITIRNWATDQIVSLASSNRDAYFTLDESFQWQLNQSPRVSDETRLKLLAEKSGLKYEVLQRNELARAARANEFRKLHAEAILSTAKSLLNDVGGSVDDSTAENTFDSLAGENQCRFNVAAINWMIGEHTGTTRMIGVEPTVLGTLTIMEGVINRLRDAHERSEYKCSEDFTRQGRKLPSLKPFDSIFTEKRGRVVKAESVTPTA